MFLVTLCSLRPDHMGCFGYERDTTPHLDEFVSEAIIFEQAVAAWPKTAPALAALLTGRYPHSTGVMRTTPGQHLDDAETTIAEAFKARGYETMAAVTSPALAKHTNLHQGFDVVHASDRYPSEKKYRDAVDAVLAWLERPERKAPAFVWLHLNSGHFPYRKHGIAPTLFVDDEFYEPLRRLSAAPHPPFTLPKRYPNRGQIMRRDIGGYRSRLGVEHGLDLGFAIARYDAAVRATDHWLGRFFDGLAEREIFDRAVIGIVGDHGEGLGEHDYYFGHGRLPYDDCARVPMLVRLPGGRGAQRVARPVAAAAIAATLIELSGGEVSDEIELASLAGVADGGAVPELVFGESGYHPDYQVFVRHGSWKLIHVPNAFDQQIMTGVEWELYDIEDDPGELNNVINEHPEVFARLRDALASWSAPWIDVAYGRAREKVEMDPDVAERLEALGYEVGD